MKKIKVVVCEAGKLARIEKIENTLKGIRNITGDDNIEPFRPFDDNALILCNECGKINGMPMNRAVRIAGNIIDIINGDFIICSTEDSEFASLTEEQQDKYLKMFKYPEMFFSSGGQVVVIPYNPEVVHK